MHCKWNLISIEWDAMKEKELAIIINCVEKKVDADEFCVCHVKSRFRIWTFTHATFEQSFQSTFVEHIFQIYRSLINGKLYRAHFLALKLCHSDLRLDEQIISFISFIWRSTKSRFFLSLSRIHLSSSLCLYFDMIFFSSTSFHICVSFVVVFDNGFWSDRNLIGIFDTKRRK